MLPVSQQIVVWIYNIFDNNLKRFEGDLFVVF